VIADALAKGLKLDYKLALEAMIKDATVAPKDDEAEGRGGLEEYNTIGYVPYGVARGGNRTLEYSFCDWSIAQVAKHLKKEKVYNQYMAQSERWKNLWRSDYSHDGAKGFIMPRNAKGEWFDSFPYGHSVQDPRKFLYTPDISYEGPWYCAWWDCFFYEASSWEYSFSIPHDIPGLIEACGGKEAFEKRLDTFFDHGYYNVANEPSFLTPCLYNWIGRVDKTNFRIKNIIKDCYNDTPDGLPGNDDGGAMSSWLVFHMMGLYPNSGHDYYVIHEPLVDELSLTLSNGRKLHIKAVEGNSGRVYLNGKLLSGGGTLLSDNGTPLSGNIISHSQLLEGGELTIERAKSYRFVYKLHGQTRRFDVTYNELLDGSIVMRWGIKRNLKYWQGSYTMSAESREHAKEINYIQPLDKQHITLGSNELFGFVSRDVVKAIKSKGSCIISNLSYKLLDSDNGKLHIKNDSEGSELWIKDDINLPIIVKMANNPQEINWTVE